VPLSIDFALDPDGAPDEETDAKERPTTVAVCVCVESVWSVSPN
jgi:hypothetical protein